MPEPLAEGAVADLVVIRNAVDELLGREIDAFGAARFAARQARLAAVVPAMRECVRQLVRRAFEVRVIAFALLREHDAHGVVEIIRPAAIESEPARIWRTEERRIVAIVFRDDKAAGCVNPLGDLRENVLLGVIERSRASHRAGSRRYETRASNKARSR